MRNFFHSVGRMPGTWRILLVTVATGLSEGFGLTMFVPLLEMLGGTTATPSRFQHTIEAVFTSIGIPYHLVAVLIVIVALICGSMALAYLQRRMIGYGRHRFAMELRKSLTTSLLRSSWQHISSEAKGEAVNNMIVEVNRAGAALQMQIMIIAATSQVVILSVISIVLSWQMMVIAGLMAVLIVTTTQPWLKRAKNIGDGNTRANRKFAFHILDYLRGVRLIKATGAEAAIEKRLADLSMDLFEAQRDLEYNTAFVGFLLQALPVILMSLMIGVAYEVIGLEASYILVFLLLLARMALRISQKPKCISSKIPVTLPKK